CPSTDLTLTPRQRIVVRRELARLEALGEQATEADSERMKQLEESYVYLGIDTCAATGLCATQCPVGIDTGEMVRQLRRDRSVDKASLARRIGRHFSGATRVARGGLNAAGAARTVLGANLMEKMSGGARRLSGERLPQWSPALPKSAPIRVLKHSPGGSADREKVVYLPSCATRIFGAAHDDDESRSVMEITLALLDKAGYDVILPEMIGHLCCGMAFKSKGQYDEAAHKARELNRELLMASQNGRYPVLCDTSPCTLQMQEHLDERLSLLEPVSFAHDHLLPHLSVTPLDECIAVHVTCSSTRMGLSDKFVALARACAKEVVVPAEIACCGFAGDKGFNTPELNASALEGLAEQVVNCSAGYSNSRTCEIGLSQHGGIPYRSILSLLDRASQPATTPA
ncbi:MAG: (Fe-S)-binding protein, partial [Thioalkalivibrio sp.]|nr:(Fe-S)-binding protein [Thioalkalivibrio sp.]